MARFRRTLDGALSLLGCLLLVGASIGIGILMSAHRSQPAYARTTPIVAQGSASTGSEPPQPRVHPTGFFSGWFVSSRTGWMVIDGRLNRTDDGGLHWTAQLRLQYAKVFQRDMSFLDTKTGFVVESIIVQGRVLPRLLVTDDGGTSWTARPLPLAAGAV